MPFDSSTRNKLSRMVSDARRLLTGEFTGQMQEIYGIQPDGTVIEIGKLAHLDNEEFEIARALREKIDHITGEAGMDKREVGSAINRLIHEEAFTVLNRFAALRMCEERGLIQESVRAGMKSKGFLVYSTVCESGLGTTFERYKTYLFCLFDEIAVDLGLLFDRYGGKGILFPREAALLELLEAINRADLKDLWAEDETIGWIYQYFNSKEEREAMRQASAAPRNSHELAVRNQFFTPRYVVEFLTDNTLGRIWYEMRKGETGLKEKCRYLVLRPNEVFLTEEDSMQYAVGSRQGEEEEKAERNEGLSQEELLKKQVYIPHRPKKDPREIRMLDPAGGSGHFGLYAFDLFEIIYAEAYDDPDLGLALQQDYPDRTEFLHEVPRLILMHNIHIIDIDPRAVQIAALALWLRAQKSFNVLKLKPAERPRITKTNVVCAEPMPGEIDLLKEFTASLTPRLLGQIVEIIFEKMKLAGEAGTLLKIEEEIQDTIAKAREQWLKGPSKEQGELFPELEHIEPVQGLLFDLSDITDEEFWEHAEEKILDALEAYAEQAENGHAMRRRLFAEDTAQGFAFIDLCRKRYEVVLMNPPFGLAQKHVSSLIARCYPDTYVDLYASFVTRGLELAKNGMVGAITSRAFLMTKKLARWRTNELIDSVFTMLDLGSPVMDDAFVEACAFAASKSASSADIIAFDRRFAPRKDLPITLSNQHADKTPCYCISKQRLHSLPQAKMLYALPVSVHSLLKSEDVFEPSIGTVRQGMCTFDDFRFLRLRWEVSPSAIGQKHMWEPLSKGGEFAIYYSDIHLVVKWDRKGRELAEENIHVNGQTAQSRQASEFWRQPGGTYSKRSVKGFSARALPAECIFGTKGPAVLSQSNVPPACIIGWVNSRLMRFLVHVQANASEFNTGIVKRLPWKTDNRILQLANRTKETIELCREAAALSEVNTCFITIPVRETLRKVQLAVAAKREAAEQTRAETCALWDRVVDETFGVDSSGLNLESTADIEDDDDETEEEQIPAGDDIHSVLSYAFGCVVGRWDMRIAVGERPIPKVPDPFAALPLSPPGMLQGPDGLPAERQDVPSEYPVRISWNGILVDDENSPQDIVRRVREVLDVLWGERSEAIEQEACSILGVKSLRDYFHSPSGFFQDHLKRYSKSRRKAPIYWPLSTASGSYTLWIYYHRLTDQTLYLCITDYVNPKLENTRKDIERLQSEIATSSLSDDLITKGGNASRRNTLEKLIDFEQELKDFRDELLRVAKLSYKPNLNDGVMITASPLWKLFRHTSWRKDLEECWRKLETGEYDWAHVAYTMWPERVKEKCKTDKSIAIAHDLEHLYEQKATEPKKPRKSKNKTGGALT